jgi:ribosomal protein S18 acetylase RimI-like enzyme
MELIYNDKPDQKDQKYLDDKLNGLNGKRIKGYVFKSFLYKITDDSGLMIAGIDCILGGGWLEIISLWVSEHNRKKKIGESLLFEAEKTAKEQACHSSYLYTYSFQAPVFYEKNGYKIFGILENYYRDHSKFYMKKRLV